MNATTPFTHMDKTPHLKDYYRIVWKRKGIVVLTFFLLVILVAFRSYHMTPVYRATAQLLIEPENPKVVNIEEVVELNARDTDYYYTQYQLLESRSLARRVIEELRLEKNGEFKRSEVKRSSAQLTLKLPWLGLSRSNGQKIQKSDADPLSYFIDLYLSRIEIEPVRATRMVEVSFSGYSPKEVTRIANTHARLYIEMSLERKFAASQDALNWLNKRLSGLKTRVEESEETLHQYKKENDIVSLEEKQNIVVQKLAELNTALTKAKTEGIRIETLYQQMKNLSARPANLASLPPAIQNGLIQSLKGELIKLEGEHSELAQKYGPEHPHIIRLKSRMEEIEVKITQELKNIAHSIETEYSMAKAEEETLSQALEEQKQEALELNQKAIRYGVLQREAETNQNMYELFLKRAKETDLTSGLEASNIRLVDPAEVPRYPIKPSKVTDILLSMVIGLVMGIGLAFFFEYMDNTIRTPEDVERHLGLPLLGTIPKHKMR